MKLINHKLGTEIRVQTSVIKKSEVTLLDPHYLGMGTLSQTPRYPSTVDFWIRPDLIRYGPSRFTLMDTPLIISANESEIFRTLMYNKLKIVINKIKSGLHFKSCLLRYI